MSDRSRPVIASLPFLAEGAVRSQAISSIWFARIVALALSLGGNGFLFHGAWWENHHVDRPGFHLDFTQLADWVLGFGLLTVAGIVFLTQCVRRSCAPPWWIALTHGAPMVWAIQWADLPPASAIAAACVVVAAGVVGVHLQLRRWLFRGVAVAGLFATTALAFHLPTTPTFAHFPADLSLERDDPRIAATLADSVGRTTATLDRLDGAISLPALGRHEQHDCQRHNDRGTLELLCNHTQRRFYRIDGSFRAALLELGSRLYGAGWDPSNSLATDVVGDYDRQDGDFSTGDGGVFVVSDLGGSLLAEPGSSAYRPFFEVAFAEAKTHLDPIDSWRPITQPPRTTLEAVDYVAIVELSDIFRLPDR